MVVLELRNYLLKSEVLEHFIDYFEQHFISSQEKLNMRVLGQFRLLGQPNRFVWLRGFSDMQTRHDSLREFYGGPIWNKYGPTANDMMLEWHNVHLLRPVRNYANLTWGSSAQTLTALTTGKFSRDAGLIVIDIFQAKPGRREALVDNVQSRLVPVYQKLHIQMHGMFVAEMSENKFTRLPVIQNENELVVITAYENIDDFWEKCELISHAVNVTTVGLVSAERESLLLSPTQCSPLRYVKQ
jgi:hypothetical protein